ncbi:MAG: PocR ligand-binding domain-containing protein [Clostridia bacterium]
MRYQYNMERLTKLLRDFYRVSGVRIGVFSREYRQIAAIPEAASRFCTRLRQYPAIAQQCLDCDAHAFRDCREFSIYRCHMGIVEAVAPIVNDYTTYGYLMIGQLLDDTSLEEQWSHTRAQCLRYQVPANVLEELQTFFYELPIRQTEYIRSATEWSRSVPVSSGWRINACSRMI